MTRRTMALWALMYVHVAVDTQWHLNDIWIRYCGKAAENFIHPQSWPLDEWVALAHPS